MHIATATGFGKPPRFQDPERHQGAACLAGGQFDGFEPPGGRVDAVETGTTHQGSALEHGISQWDMNDIGDGSKLMKDQHLVIFDRCLG